jgi:hypothetical protein
MNNTSFICEHSAEFILVPNLCQLFSEHDKNLIPLHFWKTREGSSKSIRCDDHKPLRLIAMYARRPKIRIPNQNSITVKINYDIFEHALYLQDNNIPTIIGVPCVSSVLELKFGCSCSWFSLIPDKNSCHDAELTIDIQSRKCDSKLPLGVHGPLNDHELLSLFNKSRKFVSWQEAVNVLRNEMPSRYAMGGFFGINSYKPVYFINNDK